MPVSPAEIALLFFLTDNKVSLIVAKRTITMHGMVLQKEAALETRVVWMQQVSSAREGIYLDDGRSTWKLLRSDSRDGKQI